MNHEKRQIVSSDIESTFKGTKYGKLVLEIHDHYTRNRIVRLVVAFFLVLATISVLGLSKVVNLLVDNFFTGILIAAILVLFVDGVSWGISSYQKRRKRE